MCELGLVEKLRFNNRKTDIENKSAANNVKTWHSNRVHNHAYPHSSAGFVCDLTADTEVADGTRQG